MPLIEMPFKRVAVDLVGPIAPVTDRGNRYILTMVDYATRCPEATALKSIEADGCRGDGDYVYESRDSRRSTE